MSSSSKNASSSSSAATGSVASASGFRGAFCAEDGAADAALPTAG